MFLGGESSPTPTEERGDEFVSLVFEKLAEVGVGIDDADASFGESFGWEVHEVVRDQHIDTGCHRGGHMRAVVGVVLQP